MIFFKTTFSSFEQASNALDLIISISFKFISNKLEQLLKALLPISLISPSNLILEIFLLFANASFPMATISCSINLSGIAIFLSFPLYFVIMISASLLLSAPTKEYS